MTTPNTTPKPESVEEIVEEFRLNVDLSNKETEWWCDWIKTELTHAYTRGREDEREKVHHVLQMIKEEIRQKEGETFSRTGNVVYYYLDRIERLITPEALSTNTENP